MSMETVDNAMVIKFSDMLHVKAQQMQARLRPYCEYRDFKNADVMAYDGIGTIEAREIFGRNQPVQPNDIERNRRKMTRRQFEATVLVDQYDVEGMLSDPQGALAKECLMSMERQFDSVVLDAMFASVLTGRDFTNTVTAATDGVLTVDMTAGVTLAKLLVTRQNFRDQEVGTDIPTPYIIGVSGDEETQLLQILQLTSRDYSTAFALERGQITNVLNMQLVFFGANSTKVQLPVTAGVRRCFALVQGGVCVGSARNIQITVKDRPDLTNVKQIQVTMVMGAVRTEGNRVQQINTTDI